MSARCWKSRQKEAVETKTQRERDGRVNMTTKSHKPSKTRWGLILHLRFSALPTLVLKKTVCRASDLKNAEINREREKLQISLHISHSECKINSTLLCKLLQLFSQSMQDVLRYCMSVAKANVTNQLWWQTVTLVTVCRCQSNHISISAAQAQAVLLVALNWNIH